MAVHIHYNHEDLRLHSSLFQPQSTILLWLS